MTFALRSPRRSDKNRQVRTFSHNVWADVKLKVGCSSFAWLTGPWIFHGIRCGLLKANFSLGQSLLQTRLWLTSTPLHTCPVLHRGTQDPWGGAGVAKVKCPQTFCWGIWLNVKQKGSLLASGVHQHSRLHGNHHQPLAQTRSEYLFKTHSQPCYTRPKILNVYDLAGGQFKDPSVI